jgi:hypothetical protein
MSKTPLIYLGWASWRRQLDRVRVPDLSLRSLVLKPFYCRRILQRLSRHGSITVEFSALLDATSGAVREGREAYRSPRTRLGDLVDW